MTTETVQDYLKIIFGLTESGHPAATTILAARLGVAPASVTGMIQRMAVADPPLVNYRKHQGVTLTPAGKQAALEVIRRQHVISENLEARIASTLGNPSRDPHGDPIPDEMLVMPDDASVPLTDLLPMQPAVVLRVQPESPVLLRHLESLGIVPGVKVTVLDYSPLDENQTIGIDSRPPFVLGSSITNHIFVTSEIRS